MKNICIAGDSWGCGEWSENYNPPKVIHKGLEFYLSEISNVINVSRGANSNTDSITSLINALESNHFDLIFFFVTDPLRDTRSNNYEFFKATKLTFHDLLEENKRLRNVNYEELNKIGKKIYCIGGCSKLKENEFANYKNLIPYIPSLTEFLLPDYRHPIIWCSDWLSYVDKQFDLESLNLLASNKEIQDSLRGNKFKSLFWPDGGHPNRFGHLLLYNKIKKDFAL